MATHRVSPSFLTMVGLIALTIWAYWPGLHGAFLFDDFINLPSLGSGGPVTHWQTFWRYVTSGQADPTGRPLAILTFLIDARDWPADPFAFKRTNLILHLINGGLLALLLSKLGELYLEPEESHYSRRRLTAAIGAGIWLLHPLLVSTTLYVVQREAMLPTTLTLVGLLLWLRGRRAMLLGHRRKGAVWVFAGLGLSTILAMLCKANGILLPTLALSIELTVPRARPCPPRAGILPLLHSEPSYRTIMWLFAGLPTLFIAGYLAYVGWQGITQDLSATRPWTLSQRLLTEPRVLAEYLKLLWLPRPFTTGLFNDQVVASTSLSSPPTTLWAMLLVAAMIATALLVRRHYPLFSLAILFYFTAQLMESSTIALELYFEHRNYLPSLLLFWPLAAWLCDARSIALHRSTRNRVAASAEWRWIKMAIALLLILGLALMTYARASLWGNNHEQALLWAKLNPDSARAQANAAMAETSAGHPERAVTRLQPLLRDDPSQVQVALNLLSASCALGRIDTPTLDASARALRITRDTGTLLTSWFERAIEQAKHPSCPELTTKTLAKLLAAGRANPNFTRLPGRRQDLDYLEGRLALVNRQPDQALASFNRALDQQVRPGIALQQAALLGAAGQPSQALAHLDHYEATKDREEHAAFGMPRIHAWVLERQQYWPKELNRLRHTLMDDLKAQAK